MKILILVFFLILAIGILLVVRYGRKRRHIAPNRKAFFQSQLKRIIASESYKWQIIDIDKLYHKILLEAGYEWSFWEILKQEPQEILDIDKIWDLHKLRNKLVHEFDLLSQKSMKAHSDAYVFEVKKLLRKFD